MPLLRKRPYEVDRLPDGLVNDTSSTFWQIRFTGEIFQVYEEYLEKLHLYRRRIWTCEFSGASSLTYEQALKSEIGANQWIEKLPRTHMKAMLLKCQWSTAKLEELVNDIYLQFTESFLPGQELEALDGESGATTKIRTVKKLESASAAMAEGVDDDMMMDMMQEVRYEVEWLEKPERAGMLCAEDQIIRPPKVVATKGQIKNVVKAVTKKDFYPQAPYEIRTELAAQYGISTELPLEFQRARNYHYEKREQAEKEATARKLKGETAAERKQREIAERKAERDEERRRRKEQEATRIKFPMEDELLPAAGIQPPQLQLPVGLPLHVATLPALAGVAISTWCAINNFGTIWAIAPFSFEDFDQALHHQAHCNLMSEVYVALLRVALETCKSYYSTDTNRPEAERRLDPNCPEGKSYTRAEFLEAYGPEAGDSRWIASAPVDDADGLTDGSGIGATRPKLPADWILHVDTDRLDPRIAETWEPVLNNFLQFQHQMFEAKQQDFATSREYFRSAMAAIDDARAGVDVLGDRCNDIGNSPRDTTEHHRAQTDMNASDTSEPHCAAKSTREGSEATKQSSKKASSRRQQQFQEELQRDFRKFQDSLIHQVLREKDGERKRADIFMDLPDRKIYPDYYQLIKLPIAITVIRKRVRSGAYADADAYERDWFTLGNNAKDYNAPDSQVCQDAEVIMNLVRAAFQAYRTNRQVKEDQFSHGEEIATDDDNAGRDADMHPLEMYVPGQCALGQIDKLPGIPLLPVGTEAAGSDGLFPLAHGTAPITIKLAILEYLVNEALSAGIFREHLDALLEEADIVKRELREHTAAIRQAKKDEMERLKAAEAASGDTTAAAGQGNGSEGHSPNGIEQPSEPDPLAEMRAALGELHRAETAKMSRSEQVTHKKVIKVKEDELRREEAALESRIKREQAAARRAQIDQRKKMLGFYEKLDKLQTRGKPIGHDRHRNRYWLIKPIGAGHIIWDEECFLIIETAAKAPVDANISGTNYQTTDKHTGANRIICQWPATLPQKWAQISTEAELNALMLSLEPKGVRELGLREALMKHMPAIREGLRRLAKFTDPGQSTAALRQLEKGRTKFLSYKNKYVVPR